MEKINDRLTSDRYQAVRLVDVFILAPSMVYASTFKQIPKSVRLVLLVSGVATLVFNGINYMDIQKNKNK